MADTKENSPLIWFAVVAVILSLVLNIYVYVNIEPIEYRIRFQEFVDDNWVGDLHDKILWHFPNWTKNGNCILLATAVTVVIKRFLFQPLLQQMLGIVSFSTTYKCNSVIKLGLVSFKVIVFVKTTRKMKHI